MNNISFFFDLERNSFVLNLKKSDDLLIYKNELNSIAFPENFTARDYDIFFTLCWFAKQEKSKDLIVLPFAELTRFYDDVVSLNKTRFFKEIALFCNKVLGKKGAIVVNSLLSVKNEDKKYKIDSFFISIEADKDKQELSFQINKYALDMLWATCNFMGINLQTFVSIKGKFAKTLYRILKQYENIKADANGLKSVSFNQDNFVKLMNIPENYKSFDIKRRAIEPAINELDETYFKTLFFEQRSTKSGRKRVINYGFCFEFENKAKVKENIKNKKLTAD